MDTMLSIAVLLLTTIMAGAIALVLQTVFLRAAFALMPQPQVPRRLAPPIERGTRLAARAYGQRR